MRESNRWKIQLGEDNWSRFTYARPEGSALRLLGSVTRGAQVGALAETADGRFVQVNGDHVTPLSDAQVRRAVGAARRPVADVPQRPTRSQAVVTIKKRRVIARPEL